MQNNIQYRQDYFKKLRNYINFIDSFDEREFMEDLVDGIAYDVLEQYAIPLQYRKDIIAYCSKKLKRLGIENKEGD
jgi:hypothetical protein